jgi:hypothetical protein
VKKSVFSKATGCLSSYRRTTTGDGRPLMSRLSWSVAVRVRSSLVMCEYGDRALQPASQDRVARAHVALSIVRVMRVMGFILGGRD